MKEERAVLERADIKPLWTNCSDSLFHAVSHLEERSGHGREKDAAERSHNGKWVTLSVAHAADCYLKIMAKECDQNSSLFRSKPPDCMFRNPSVPETIKFLRRAVYDKKIRASEKKLFSLIEYLHEQRNRIIHHMIPEEVTISVSVAVWVILGLLRSVTQRYGLAPEEVVGRHIGKDALDWISIHRHEPYTEYVEMAVQEAHEAEDIEECPLCGAMAVVYWHCEVCFAEVSKKECPGCGNEIIFPTDKVLAERAFACPFCGKSG
jgi:hypothetical protein